MTVMNKIMRRLFWYLAEKFDYSIVLRVGKDFHFTDGIESHMSDGITVYFA